MMVKQFAGLRIEPDALKRLKMLAARVGVPMGDVVAGFLLLNSTGQVTDDALREAVNALKSMPRQGFVADDPEAHRAWLIKAARLARESGEENEALQFEKRLAAMDAE